MLNQCPDGNWTSKPHGMVKCGNAVLVGSVDVGPGLEQGDEPPPLVCGVWIALAADARQFVFHWVTPFSVPASRRLKSTSNASCAFELAAFKLDLPLVLFASARSSALS